MSIRMTKKPPTNFHCSSFKDIHLLFSDENTPPKSTSPRSPSIFHRVRLVNSLLRSWSTRLPPQSLLSPPPISLPGTDDRVVIFHTSLRIVRSTFDDCRTVRSILRSFPVVIDERDVSMDHSYFTELHQIFSLKNSKSKISLPKVFVGGRFIGGADEVRQLHESGELKKLLSGLPPPPSRGACDFCGGYRFVLCEDCNGSRKIYSEKGGFRTCSVCNENGLLRCPICSSSS